MLFYWRCTTISFVTMAKQAGDIFIEGSFGDLTFYKMEGKYYVRTKSSLTGKRFWKAKCFEGSRKSCSRFGEGNKLASKVYGMIEEEKKVNKLFAFLRTKAISLIKQGFEVAEAEEVLIDYLIEFGFLKDKQQAKAVEEAEIKYYEDVKEVPFLFVYYKAVLKTDSS